MVRPNPSTLVSSVPLVVDLELEDRMLHELGTDVAESQGYFMPRS
jgi:hypothetical protein